ncbi:MAG: response regulator [Pseudomonadales bacterium]
MTNNTRILLVEDNVSLATVYQSYLSGQPFEVTHVATVADARSYLFKFTPDIILLDIELPDGNGLDILKQINQERRELQVIMMTDHGASDLAIEAVGAGAFDFLIKPFDAGRLLVTMANANKLQLMSRRLQTFTEILPRSLEKQLAAGAQQSSPTFSAKASNDEELSSATPIEPLWIIERRAIENVIAAFDGHVNKAAAALEVAPSTIYRKMQSWKNENHANVG